MADGWKYTRRSEQQMERRATQTGGGFEGYFHDDFAVIQIKKGENWLRICPATWENPGHYGMDIFVHFGIGPDNASVLCLSKMKGQPCPLCEARAKFEREADEDAAKSLRPIQRVAVWVLDLNEENKGPQLWGMPWSLDRDIAKICKDRRTGERYYIDDPDSGYDLFMTREGEGRSTKYVGLALDRRPSSLPQKAMDFVVENPLPEVLRWRNYKEILELYHGGEVVGRRDGQPTSRGRDERGGDRSDRREDSRPERSSRSSEPPDDDPRFRRGRDEDKEPERSSRSREEERPSRSRDEERPARSREPEPEERRSRGNGHDAEEEPRRSRSRDPDDTPAERPSRTREEPEERPSRASDEPEERPSRTREDPPADRRPSRESIRDDEPPSGSGRAAQLRARYGTKE